MRFRTLLVSTLALFLAGPALAQIGGHPTDTSVINGSLSLGEEECYDDYFFSGRTGQILWADIDSSWYVKQDGMPGLEPGFCLQVLDRYGELICWSAGQSIGHLLLGHGIGWNPASTCYIPANNVYTLRVAVNNWACYMPVECDRLEPVGFRSPEQGLLVYEGQGLEALALGIQVPGLQRPERQSPDLTPQQLPDNGYYELKELPYLLNVSLRNQATEGHIFGAVNDSRNIFPRP
jgi:hypothetical protein